MPKKMKKILGFVLFFVIVLAVAIPNFNPGQSGKVMAAGAYGDRFLSLYTDIMSKGYLSPEGIPYYSVETLMVEDPVDYGHETTSDTLSYYTWLTATYGAMTGNWTDYKNSWDKIERYVIPTAADQPGIENYDPNNPCPYTPQADQPELYPVAVNPTFPTGIDPVGNELKNTYTAPIYQMHRLLDVDNWYRYGNHGDGTSRASYIDSYARGPQESVWETIPHPCWENFKWGSTSGGFLPLFITNTTLTNQWQYATMGSADARQIQASYWAYTWASDQGKSADIAPYTAKAAKLGDFLRYVMFDKYFKPIGIQTGTNKGTGYDSCHYLVGQGLTWGAEIGGVKSWRTGSSDGHQGYQNPVAAYALVNAPGLFPQSPNGRADWTTSLARQIELYQYLQSAEGPIAGGVTNSWGGRYLQYPAGASTFYQMAYDMDPIYHDPPSNMWFGYQTWSMERLAEYYYLNGDNKAKWVLDKWVNWALSKTSFNSDGTYSIPAALNWSGQPDPWTGTYSANANLHCSVSGTTNDVGVAASLAKVLIYYAAGSSKWAGDAHLEAKTAAAELLDRMWNLYRDTLGVAAGETRTDYIRFFGTEWVPASFSGTNGQGATVKNGMTFIDLHPLYKNDPAFAKIQTYYGGGAAPVFTYHRFWAQAEIAMANALFQMFFFVGTPTPTIPTTITPTATAPPTVTPNPTNTPTSTPTPTPTLRPTATPTPTLRGVTPTITRRVATVTPTRRATPTPTRRVTPTPTTTQRVTVTATPTATATATPTPPIGTGTPTPTTVGYYAVSYVIQSDWGTGATISVTIFNYTSVAVNGWILSWTGAPGEIITNIWNVTYTQSGASISVHDGGFNAIIPANGGSVNFGFNMNHTGSLVKPTDFKLNGVPCQVL